MSDTTPFWLARRRRTFPSIARNLKTDVVVVGAGISGLTAGYLLKRAGLSVAVIDKGRLGQGETGHTTAHLAAVTDVPFSKLVATVGLDHARATWDAGFAAIAQIEAIVASEEIDCAFARTEGFLTAPLDRDPTKDDVTQLEQEATAARDAGFDAELVASMPGLDRPAVRYDHQARFHPVAFTAHLASAIHGGGSYVFELSEVDKIELDPVRAHVGSHVLTADRVVIATHSPLQGAAGLAKAALLQTDLYGYSSYALRARIPKGRLPAMLCWDTNDPYWYLRVDPGGPGRTDHLILGGADHKTGQEPAPEGRYARVEQQLLKLCPEAAITHRWSGQVIESRDGLPYLGETTPRQFVMTGYAGNGMTFGVVGAMMARDLAVGVSNPWRDLFDLNRTRVTAGLWDYLKENSDYPYYMIRDRFAGPEGRSVRSVRNGEGKLLELDGKRVAAHRDSRGRLHLLSPTCTHMGCLVAWNSAEATWDCPCHGSRFKATGEVIAGPAEQPLAPLEPTESAKRAHE